MNELLPDTAPEASLVVPGTGELVDLNDEVAVGKALHALREFAKRVKYGDDVLTHALVAASQKLGTKTIHLPDGHKVEITGGVERVYDAVAIETELRAAGMPEERIREIIAETVSYKVNATKAKGAAAANPEYREIIERHTTEHEKKQYARVQ